MTTSYVINNQFATLELPTDASNSQIRQRVNEFSIRARVSGLDDQRFRSAAQILNDPVERLAHEAFWVSDISEEVIHLLTSGNEKIITEMYNTVLITNRKCDIKNRAVVSLILACIYDINNQESKQLWRFVVDRWNELITRNIIENCLLHKIDELKDIRLNQMIAEIRMRIAQSFVDSLMSKFITQCANGENSNYHEWIQIFEVLQGPERDCVRDRLNRLSNDLVKQVEARCSDGTRLLDSGRNEPRGQNATRQRLIDQSVNHIESAKRARKVLETLDPNNLGRVTFARNTIGQALQQLSAFVYAFCDNYNDALVYITQAKNEVKEEILSAQIENNIKLLSWLQFGNLLNITRNEINKDASIQTSMPTLTIANRARDLAKNAQKEYIAIASRHGPPPDAIDGERNQFGWLMRSLAVDIHNHLHKTDLSIELLNLVITIPNEKSLLDQYELDISKLNWLSFGKILILYVSEVDRLTSQLDSRNMLQSCERVAELTRAARKRFEELCGTHGSPQDAIDGERVRFAEAVRSISVEVHIRFRKTDRSIFLLEHIVFIIPDPVMTRRFSADLATLRSILA